MTSNINNNSQDHLSKIFANNHSFANTKERDEYYIRRAIELSKLAVQHGNHPFGALLVDSETNQVLMEAENTVYSDHDVTCHAETNLVSKCCKCLTNEQLQRSILYTSTEPCCMCAGAIFWASIPHVVYSCSNEVLGEIVQSCSSGENKDGGLHIPCRRVFSHCSGRSVQVTGPILEQESRKIHESYWPNH